MKKTILILAAAFSMSMATSAHAQSKTLPELPPTLGGLLSGVLGGIAKATAGEPSATSQTVPANSEALRTLAAFAEQYKAPQDQCSDSSLRLTAEIGANFRQQGRKDVAAVSYRKMAGIFAWCSLQPQVPGSAMNVSNAAKFLTLSIQTRGGVDVLFKQDAQLAYEISELAGNSVYAETKSTLESLDYFDARKPRVVQQASSYDVEATAAQLNAQFSGDASVFRHKNAGKSVKVRGYLRHRVDLGPGKWSFELVPSAGFTGNNGTIQCRTLDSASIDKGIAAQRGQLLTVSGQFDFEADRFNMVIARCVVH